MVAGATALVLLMTPGLAYFYGGMVRKKNVISTMLQSLVCMGVITVLWVMFGFSLAFGGNDLYFGETKLFLVHLLALVVVSVFAFVGSYVLLMITNAISPLRVIALEEEQGLDLSQHNEEL
jgi:ammonia channel protein AmtB